MTTGSGCLDLAAAYGLEESGSEQLTSVGVCGKLGWVFDPVGQCDRDRGGSELVQQRQRCLETGVVVIQNEILALEATERLEQIRSEVGTERGHCWIAPHVQGELVERPLHDDYRGRASGVIQPEQRFGAGQAQMHWRIVRQVVVESAP